MQYIKQQLTIVSNVRNQQRPKYILVVPVTNYSEKNVEDLLAQVAGRFFWAFCFFHRRDALNKIEIARSRVSELLSIIQKALPGQRNAQ